ncbi:MAG TPA: glycosyltransferase family 4 protein, partial [Armatimonadota bacterium]|nr:glycosyltransferase family 4 protein [Armatimonadota bacterium]
PMARPLRRDTVQQLAGWARRDAADLLHVHSAKAGYLGRRAAEIVGLPVVYTPHAFPFQRTTDPLRPLYRAVERRLARTTARIICVSDGEAREALDAGLPEERLAVIPNGIDPGDWRPPAAEQRRAARAAHGITDDAVVVGALARFVPQKGLDLLLMAAEDFLPDFPHARVMLWGEGPGRKALQGLAKRLRLTRVSFPGPAHDPRQAYAAMDIFVAPSRWEAGPYAVLEAMACGLPVVAADVAGNADYVLHDDTGLLTPPELPGPIAGALRPLLADLDLRAAYGAAGRARVETAFTLDRMIAATLAVYRAVTREREEA